MKIRKEAKIKSMGELRALCIKMDWFTCGDNKSYDKFLQIGGNGSENATSKRLLSMAELIYNCSDRSYWSDRQEAYENIIFTLWKDGVNHLAWLEE